MSFSSGCVSPTSTMECSGPPMSMLHISLSVHVLMSSSSWPILATATHMLSGPYTFSPRASSTSSICRAHVAQLMNRGGSYSFFPRHSASTLGSFTRMSSKRRVCRPRSAFSLILS